MERSNSVPAETAKSDALPHPNVSVHDYIPLFPCTDPKIAADEMTDSKYRGRCLKDLFCRKVAIGSQKMIWKQPANDDSNRTSQNFG